MNKTETPEYFMKLGFDYLHYSRKKFEQALPLYMARNDDNRADSYNAENLKKALQLMNQAYDEISVIWENDINV